MKKPHPEGLVIGAENSIRGSHTESTLTIISLAWTFLRVSRIIKRTRFVSSRPRWITNALFVGPSCATHTAL